MMGIMTLALSVFSLIPMSIFLVNRVFMSQVVTHLVEEYSVTGGDSQVANGGGGGSGLDSVAFWGTVNEALNNDRTNLPPEDDEKVVWLASVMYIFFIISLILLALFAVMSILLIYGAAKGKRWFMLPWIICTFGFLLAYLGGMCLSLWLIGLQVISVLLFFIALVEICIAFYLWLCVVSLFQVRAI